MTQHSITFIFYFLEAFFLFVCLIHLYWGLGGKMFFDFVLPRDPQGELYFHPKKKWAFVIVGIFLLLFVILYFFDDIQKKFHYLYFIFLFVFTVFFVRGVGDFKKCGLFKKKVKNKFFLMDTIFYTPLCFIVALLCFIAFLYEINNTSI
ncbi:MAG: DUF3995 domain-containing protein [Commensalibacter sp.]